MTNISNNIKFLRTKKGMSQTAMAEAVGLKRGNIASYEKELAQPSIENLVKIADYFGTDLQQLIQQDLSIAVEPPTRKSYFKLFEEGFPLQNLKDKVAHLTERQSPNIHLKKLREENKEIYKMMEGFKAFHKMRMKSKPNEKELFYKVCSDYEDLLDVLGTVLKSNDELIRVLETASLSDD